MLNKDVKYLKFRDILQIIFAVLIVSLILKLFVIETLKIPSSSMENTLLPGDFVLLNKMYYDLKLPKYFPFTNIELGDIKILSFRNPKKGDIIAFYLNDYKNLNSMIFVKRCVGEPGDSITIGNKNIYLPKQGDKIILNKNNINELKPLLIKDGCIVDTQYDSLIIVNGQVVSSYEFKNDYYFFVGDNFTKSFDSRNFGPIPRKDIIGKIVLVFWSINNENIVKNYFSTVRWNRLGMVVW